MDLFDEILDYLETRQIAFIRRFTPYFLCSFGAHLLNLENIKRRFYFELGDVKDLRLHFMFVSPSGFSKSLYLKQFLKEPFGVLSEAKIPVKFASYMTEPGWVGTIKFKNHEKQIIPGLAQEFSNGIIGVEEFIAIEAAMSQEHSKGFEAAILDSLDGGLVRKRLAAGSIEYTTHVTLWAGTRQAQFNLTSGLGRRFAYILWNPTLNEMKLVKEMRRKGRNIPPEPVKLKEISDGILQLKSKLQNLEKVTFTKNLDDLLEDVVHYEDSLYERLAMGYFLLRGQFNKELILDVDLTLRNLITNAIEFRRDLMMYGEAQIVLGLLKDGPLHIDKVVKALIPFGYYVRQSRALIARLINLGVIQEENRFLKVRK